MRNNNVIVYMMLSGIPTWNKVLNSLYFKHYKQSFCKHGKSPV